LTYALIRCPSTQPNLEPNTARPSARWPRKRQLVTMCVAAQINSCRLCWSQHRFWSRCVYCFCIRCIYYWFYYSRCRFLTAGPQNSISDVDRNRTVFMENQNKRICITAAITGRLGGSISLDESDKTIDLHSGRKGWVFTRRKNKFDPTDVIVRLLVLCVVPFLLT
jgi:hypothetical protein